MPGTQQCGMRVVAPLEVAAGDVRTLLDWLEPGSVRSALRQRAQIVLLARGGFGPTRITDTLGCSKQTVITWRDRYRAQGLAGLTDAPRSGRPPAVDPDLVISRTRQPPPPHLGAARWSSRLLAAELGISNVTVAKIWRAHDIYPHQPDRDSAG